MVISRFGQMPKVVDHTSADKRFAFVIKCDTPRVAGSFTKQLEPMSRRIDAKHRASEIECVAVLFDNTAIKDAVETIKISVGAPSECVWQFVSVVASKPGHDDGLFIGFIVAVGIF